MIKKMYVILLILFFINVANDIGKGIIFDESNHPSIDRIRKNIPKNNIDFDFKPTNTDTITKLVNKINIKKATGVDQISYKLLKAGSPVLNKHLTTLLNNTIKHSQFPNRLKEAQVVPLHKKNDPLDKNKLSSCQYSANNFKNL
jgi:hypothetical protein